MKYGITFFLVLFLTVLLIFPSYNCSEGNSGTLTVEDSTVTEPDTITIKLAAVGDLMCHSTQFKYADTGNGYDFVPVYREMKPYFDQADYLFGNFETLVAGEDEKFTGYPRFNSPDEYLDAVKEAGFDFLWTSNNHSLDRGADGIERTLNLIDSAGIGHTGTYRSQEESDSISVVEAGGLSIAVLSYSYGTNGIDIPAGKDYLINLIDYDEIRDDMRRADTLGTDLVLVYYHFGAEYTREPNSYQKNAVDTAVQYGADIIIGGHPHTLQPVDYYKANSSRIDSGFVAYSMGNFISNQRRRYTDAGIVLFIELTKIKSKDTLFISNTSYLPTWVFKGENIGREYIILPAEAALEDSTYMFLSKSDRNKMEQAFEDTKSTVTKYTDRINLHPLK